MRYGYWLPVFGGWLRNVEDEGMEASWDYVSRLARRSEQIGYDLTLVAELNLNDIKGVEAPSLDAWSTAAALAAVTERLGLAGTINVSNATGAHLLVGTGVLDAARTVAINQRHRIAPRQESLGPESLS